MAEGDKCLGGCHHATANTQGHTWCDSKKPSKANFDYGIPRGTEAWDGYSYDNKGFPADWGYKRNDWGGFVTMDLWPQSVRSVADVRLDS